MPLIKKLTGRLQQTNEKAYYLALLRVLTSLWLLKELLFRWPAFDVLYSNDTFLKMRPGGIYFLHPYLYQLREYHMFIIYACVVLLILNVFGIGRNLVSFLVFLSLAVLQTINKKFSNGGDLMALLLTFYLSAANTFSYFTIIKRKPFREEAEKLYNVLSNLAAFSIMINLSFIYLMAAVGKLEDAYWRDGTALHYFMNNERSFVFATGGRHIELPKFLLYGLDYGTIALELAAPVLIWFRKFRLPVFFLLFLMHAAIYSFFMLYGMSVIFVIQYGLFFSEQEIRGALQKMKNITGRKPAFIPGS